MRTLRLFNPQRVRALDKRLLNKIGRCLLGPLLKEHEYEIAAHFVDAEEITRLNQTFLRHQGSTDVITFDYSKEPDVPRIYGEIFISVDDAVAYARRHQIRWQEEVVRYFIHGVLHLQGFDDQTSSLRRVMKRQENALLKELSRRFDLRKVGTGVDAKQ